MDRTALEQLGPYAWRIPKSGEMRVPAVIYADEVLIDDMDAKVAEQITNVACVPGVVLAAYAIPEAHWGYGFPIGGVAAFDRHMPAERLSPAGLDGRHHLQLAQADMSRIGLPPCRTMGTENVSDLQLRPVHPGARSLQASLYGLVL